jgi:hypothetical protein
MEPVEIRLVSLGYVIIMNGLARNIYYSLTAHYLLYIYCIMSTELRLFIEELDGRVVSAFGVRSRKLSTGLNGQLWDG